MKVFKITFLTFTKLFKVFNTRDFIYKLLIEKVFVLMLIRLSQLECQYYNFYPYKSSSLLPKEVCLISIINTAAIESSNKPKITCGGGKII